MKHLMILAAAAFALAIASPAQAHDGDHKNGSQPEIVVNGTANGTGNTLEVDPSRGQKVTIKNSGDGKGNTIIVAPDPGGTVVINASGNGSGNKIIVEEAPGEKVIIKGSANGKNNNIIIEKVPGPIKPLSNSSPNTANSFAKMTTGNGLPHTFQATKAGKK